MTACAFELDVRFVSSCAFELKLAFVAVPSFCGLFREVLRHCINIGTLHFSPNPTFGADCLTESTNRPSGDDVASRTEEKPTKPIAKLVIEPHWEWSSNLSHRRNQETKR